MPSELFHWHSSAIITLLPGDPSEHGIARMRRSSIAYRWYKNLNVHAAVTRLKVLQWRLLEIVNKKNKDKELVTCPARLVAGRLGVHKTELTGGQLSQTSLNIMYFSQLLGDYIMRDAWKLAQLLPSNNLARNPQALWARLYFILTAVAPGKLGPVTVQLEDWIILGRPLAVWP